MCDCVQERYQLLSNSLTSLISQGDQALPSSSLWAVVKSVRQSLQYSWSGGKGAAALLLWPESQEVVPLS